MKISAWPKYYAEDIDSVTKILTSGKVNKWTGNQTEFFEKEFASLTDSKYAIAVANGSLALTCAYRSLSITKGDEIITTPRTFIATASSLVMLGAKPVFADVDINSGAITADSIEPLITGKTKAICVVHLGGWPADMEKICLLAKKFGLFVIEDCSQAHGAKIKGKSVGSFGDVATWSFCQDKIISTGGEGGMITTSSESIYEYIWSLKDHGKTINSVYKKKHKTGFRWLHENFGENFRLTEMQSAIGINQIKKLDIWTKKRNTNANLLINTFSKLDCLRIPIPNSELTHAWYKFYVYLKNEKLKKNWNREKIILEINRLGFPIFSGSCSEIYLEECFKKNSLSPLKRLPNAKELGETSLMFLVHPTITRKEMDLYTKTAYKVLLHASK